MGERVWCVTGLSLGWHEQNRPTDLALGVHIGYSCSPMTRSRERERERERARERERDREREREGARESES